MKKLLVILLMLGRIIYSYGQHLDLCSYIGISNYNTVINLYPKDSSNNRLDNVVGSKRFQRWDFFWKKRIGYKGDMDEYVQARIARADEVQKKHKLKGVKNNSLSLWESLGPYERPSGNSSQIGRGRFISIWVHPANPDFILAGHNNSGLWKTTNGGINWINLTDGYELGGISDIAVDPNNSSIIYIVTRVGARGTYYQVHGSYSLGIYKSIDGGNSWRKLDDPSLSEDYSFSKVKIHPSQSNIIYAMSFKEVYKSIDYGNSWQSTGVVLNTNASLKDMEFHVNNPNVLYISGANALQHSQDGGTTWHNDMLTTLNPDYQNSLIGIDVYNDYLYVIYSDIDKAYSEEVIERTNDYGASWDRRVKMELSGVSFLSEIWIASDGDVYAGGVGLYRSSDFGSTWNSVTNSSIHADQRSCYIVDNFPDRIFIANDGGVYKSEYNGANWVNINGDLACTEFYSFDYTEADKNAFIAGAHDCGTYLRNSLGEWRWIAGGDGGTCLLDNNNKSIYYYTIGGGGPIKFYRNGTYSCSMLAFDTPVLMDPNNSHVLYKGSGYDLKVSYDNGSSWNQISNFGKSLLDLDIYRGNSNVFYLVNYTKWNVGRQHSIFKTSDGGISFEESSYNGLDFDIRNPITSINVCPFDESIVFVTVGGFESGKKLYCSRDYGDSWVNVSGSGLPNLPLQCFQYDYIHGKMYAGTDVGVYVKEYNGLTWVKDTDFPDVIVTDMKINYSEGDLLASTYGRGLYRLDLGAGYCYSNSVLNISSSIIWDSDVEICDDVVILSGSTLTISAEITLSSQASIEVVSGGELIIDGGQLFNANVIVNSGASIKLLNNAQVECSYLDDIIVASGGAIEIVSGEINRNTLY